MLRDRLLALLEPLAEQLGFELVEVEFAAGVRSGVLRVFIDRAGGAEPQVGIEDCELMSREISALLDVEDPIPSAYTLEVSSPGFDRVLRKPAHFQRFVGERVKLELSIARDGRRRYTGTLMQVSAGGVTLEVDTVEVNVSFAEIGKARLVA